jgi:sterol desaturase/sphingolipid hydroxylase (fatty acid hydroxylase superfamily)
MEATPELSSGLEGRVVQLILKFPKGSIWQTRFLCFPASIVSSTLVLSHSAIGVVSRVAWFVTGMLLWTLLEYIIHRWVFHYEPSTRIGKALLKRLHTDHHEDPADQSQVCIPFVLCVAVWLWVLSSLLLLGVEVERSFLFISGLALAMTVYDLTHFSTHYMKAPNRLLQTLKKHHMLHHFSNSQTRFGVTSPFWDHVFGTKG